MEGKREVERSPETPVGGGGRAEKAIASAPRRRREEKEGASNRNHSVLRTSSHGLFNRVTNKRATAFAAWRIKDN